MRPIISRTIGKANLGVLRGVERFFEGEQLLLHRTVEALFFAFFGLCAIYIAHDFTEVFFVDHGCDSYTCYFVQWLSFRHSYCDRCCADGGLPIHPANRGCSIKCPRHRHFVIVVMLAVSMSVIVATLRRTIQKRSKRSGRLNAFLLRCKKYSPQYRMISGILWGLCDGRRFDAAFL